MYRPRDFIDFIEKSTNSAVEVLDAVSKHDKGSYDDLYNSPDPCHWHVYVDTPRCDAKDGHKDKARKTG
jgi:hypothetical protein